MKKLLTILTISICANAFAQIVTDSINTPIGEFVLVTTEEFEESSGYSEESTTTADGGSVELISIGSSGSRIAAPATVSKLSIRLLPNPSSGVVELRVSGVEGITSIVVTNVLGQIIYSTNITVSNTQTAYLPAQLWASGAYVVITSAGGQIATERLVVE